MKSRVPIVIGVVTLVGLGGIFLWRIQQSKERDAAARAATEREVITSVRTGEVQKKDLPQVVQITGSVKAANEVMVLPKMPGRVTRVAVEVGGAVRANDVLAAVEAVDMSLRVKQAEAQLMAAKAGLDQATVQAEQAGRGFERATALREKGAMSQLDFENAEAGKKLAGVGVQAALAQVALAESNLALVQKSFDDTRITTPIAGVVTKKMVNVGTMANVGSPSFAVQDQSALKMEGTVPAAYVPLLKLGMSVEVAVDELPGRSFAGTISRLAPTLEQETRRGAIEIALKPAPGLLPYMFGRATIAFGSSADVIVVPNEAVLSIGGQPAVYVVQGDVAKLVRPKLGVRQADDVVVEDGLSVGDAVVISGAAGLADGVKVKRVGT
jgi:RND family efflux transporter MFP subunit